ncbi:MAG: hypothetical protein JNJ75_00985 [Cyclobacteriaceae bacterium]|nr:hypothetical protein [Cyclobacteriaceae bacterium]
MSQKEEQDKIIVFREYESSIDANVAKTKLDAYDVPCFLTQENLNNLMAQNPFLFRIKLHIFSNDTDRAKKYWMTFLIATLQSPARIASQRKLSMQTAERGLTNSRR